MRLHNLDERASLPTHPPPLSAGRFLQVRTPHARHDSQIMYWALAGVWVAFFLVWAALVFSPGKRRRGLRLFLFVRPPPCNPA